MAIPLLLLLLGPVAALRGPVPVDSTLHDPSFPLEAPAPLPPPEPLPRTTDLAVAPNVQLIEVANHEGASRMARQSARSFLYQVLLAAVTALVTALVWKAVS